MADAVEALQLYKVDRAKGEEQLKELGLRAISVCTIHFSSRTASYMIHNNTERLLDY